MNEDELTELSKKVFDEVVEQVKFPENVQVTKDENNEYSFTQTLSNNIGIAIFYFKPSLFIIKEYLRNPERLEEAVGKDLTEEVTVVTSQALLFGLLTNFHCEIDEAFNRFIDSPILLMTKMMASMAKDIESKSKIEKRWEKEFNEIVNERSKEVSRRIKNQLDEVAHQEKVPNKNLISIFYSDALEKWKETKKFHRQNSKYSNWIKMALIAFPDLLQDLIFRLENPDPYISMPSSIALEHAARLCGYKNNSIELRTLQNYLKESRLWRQNKHEEELKKEIKSSSSTVAEQVILAIKISESLEQDVNWENYSLIHQTLFKESLKINHSEDESAENLIK